MDEFQEARAMVDHHNRRKPQYAAIAANPESLTEKAVRTAAMLEAISKQMAGVNDYGDATGFCDEEDQLVQDFHAMLGSLRARASRLGTRLTRHQLKK